MPPKVFLHIGTPKSGTTYLQSRFVRNAERAAARGLLWPGPDWGAHVAAARDLKSLAPHRSLKPRGPWSEIARQAKAWQGGSVLISMEWLIDAQPHQISAALESLQPCKVEVIVTARDLLRTFVAQYQEMTKNERPWTWSQFVDEMQSESDGPASTTFWRQQDLPEILSRWSGQVGGENTHLVTLPPAGSEPDLLWDRFTRLLGIDGSDFAPPQRDNASLGVVSTALMQRLNVAALARDMPLSVYKPLIQNAVGRQILAQRREQEDALSVSEETDTWLRKRSDAMLTDVRALDPNVVGSLEDLVPGRPLQGREPSEVTEAELLDTAVTALVALGDTQFREIRRLRDHQRVLEDRIEGGAHGRGADVLRRARSRLGRLVRVRR
ncbi:MAG: hypothetical protein ACRDO2_02335 [Nocardioidaceae bacterium]